MPDIDTMLIPLIPQVSDLAPAHRDFQLDVFAERRERALVELRMLTGLPELVSNLTPDRVYRLVIPEGTLLQKGKDGFYAGVVRKDGKISQHARFDRLPPDLARVASAIGSQVLLMSIAMQLNRVEKAVAAISHELHDDRMAQVLAGARLYDGALQMRVGDSRNGQLLNAIQTLTVGFDQVRLELSRQIRELPDTSNNLGDNWITSKADLAASKLGEAEVTCRVALQGLSLLSECYAALDEPQAGAAVLSGCVADLRSCGIQRAAARARLVEVRDRNFPETTWLEFDTALASVREALQTQTDVGLLDARAVEVEFRPHELMEAR